jgi:hypothetical protein
MNEGTLGSYLGVTHDELSKQQQDSWKTLEKEIGRGSYDYEGYQLRLTLAATIENECYRFLKGGWLENTWEEVVGASMTETLSELDEGMDAFHNAFKAKPVPHGDLSKWHSFCVLSHCTQRFRCLFLFSTDLLRILRIPFAFPRTSVAKALQPLTLKSTWVDDCIRDGFNSVASLFRSKAGQGAASDREPLTSALILEYLALKSKAQAIDLSTYPVNVQETVRAVTRSCNSGSQSNPVDVGLWESVRVAPGKNDGSWNEPDRSISPTLDIGSALVSIGNSIPDLKRETEGVIERVLRLTLDLAKKKFFLTRCYGRDYYCGIGDLSDIKGAIQSADFMLNVINVYPPSKKLGSELRSELVDVVRWLVAQQRKGLWPVVSKYAYEESRKLSDSSRGRERASSFLVYSGPPEFNVSLTNTVESLRILARVLALLRSKYCADDHVQVNTLSAKFCPKCGKELGTQLIPN